ncbi:MAG: glycosyltransferase [Anaerolineae bacterium]|nr:glycosyltransferase [Anaerolineae bacterium]
MKILFVTPNLPAKQSGSALIAYNYLKYLARNHSVDLISFCHKGNISSTDLMNWCNQIELLDHPPRWEVILKMGLGLITDWPLPVSHYATPKAKKLINHYLYKNDYDVVIFQLTEMAQFKPQRYKGGAILSLENPRVVEYERMASIRRFSWYTRLWTDYERKRLRRYEQRHGRQFHRVLLINPSDIQDYQHLYTGINFDWVPYGIDTDFFSPISQIRQEGMIVITGNMNHPPNVDGVEYFCEHIFPIIRQQVPSANLWIIGANPVPAITRCAKNEQINVTGFVPDVRSYLSRAMVSVCPIRLKLGSQTKVLEALACGTPVVTTSAGNVGIGATSGKHLYVTDTPMEFADRVISLLNHENWGVISQYGRQFVVDHLAWEKCVIRLENILYQVIEETNAQL